MRKDLKDIDVGEGEWYAEARRSRAGWRAMYRLGLEECRDAQTAQASVASRDVVCETCARKFRREGDKKRHKCVDERRKPVNEQLGAVQCQFCQEWFRSRGGLAVHMSRPGS